MYAPRVGGWGQASIAYYMQKGGGWIQIACKIAFVLNGRPFIVLKRNKTTVVSAMILKVCTL